MAWAGHLLHLIKRPINSGQVISTTEFQDIPCDSKQPWCLCPACFHTTSSPGPWCCLDLCCHVHTTSRSRSPPWLLYSSWDESHALTGRPSNQPCDMLLILGALHTHSPRFFLNLKFNRLGSMRNLLYADYMWSLYIWYIILKQV